MNMTAEDIMDTQLLINGDFTAGTDLRSCTYETPLKNCDFT